MKPITELDQEVLSDRFGYSQVEDMVRYKERVFEGLAALPAAGLRYFLKQLETGKVSGNAYYLLDSNCGCLKGHVGVCIAGKQALVTFLDDDDGRLVSEWLDSLGFATNPYAPEEILVAGVGVGHTPENSAVARIVHSWVTEYLETEAVCNQ